MAGYIPVFDSVYHGTLCGRWPALAVWLTILPMADRHGHIDMTPQAMAALTGWPLDLLKQAINELMQPDPESRSEACDGRRLVLIDPNRSWGWKVVNHEKYREKARKAAYDAQRTASGADRERKEASRVVPRYPASAREVPLSDSEANTDTDTDTDTDSEKNPTASATPSDEPAWWIEFKSTYPKRAGDQGWRKAHRAARARISEGHTPEEFILGAKRYAAFCASIGKAGTEFVKQACTFLGPEKPFLESWNPPPTKAQARQDKNIAASLQWLAESEAKDAAR